MKKLLAFILLIATLLCAVPACAEENENNELVRKGIEVILPVGSTMETIEQIARDDTLTIEEKYARVTAAILSDAAGQVVPIPGFSTLVNEYAQQVVDELAGTGAIEATFENVSKNDKQMMDMYLKAAAEGIDAFTDEVADTLTNIKDEVVGGVIGATVKATEKVIAAGEAVADFFKNIF